MSMHFCFKNRQWVIYTLGLSLLSVFQLPAAYDRDSNWGSFDSDDSQYLAFVEDDDFLADGTQSYSSQAQDEEEDCYSDFHKMHVGLRHIEGRGIGYTSGYTTLEAFGIYNHNDWFMPFFDVRGHLFNNGKWAGNVGIGERTFLPSISHLFGAYCYYDVRQDNHHLTVQQVTPGIELLGKRMEYRINGYFPVGDKESHTYGYQFDRFKGHSIFVKSKKKHALTGFNAEVGAHLTQQTKYDVYLGAGPYYFGASQENSWGGQIRLNGKYREYVTIEASYSYDRIFNSVYQGSLALNYPFGGKIKKKEGNCPKGTGLLFSRAAFSPYRFEIPVIKKITKSSKAINPTTKAPWQVWFVNNTSSSSGTYESPFPTLQLAQTSSLPNDLIYVFAGDGTSTGMSNGIVLQNNQKLFGSGVSHKLPTRGGQITIPRFTTNLPNLSIVNNAVQIANNNEIAGLSLTHTSGAATFLIGNANAVINGSIHNNNLVLTTGTGNAITFVGNGYFSVYNNYFSGTASNEKGMIISPSSLGVANLDVSNNVFNGFTNAVFFNANLNGVTNASVVNNVMSNTSDYAVYYHNFLPNTTSQVRISQNQMNTCAGGVYMDSSGSLCSVIDNNEIIQSSGIGIYIEESATVFRQIVRRNTVSTTSALTNAMEFLTFADGMTLSLIDNTAITGSFYLNNNNGNPGATFNVDQLDGNIGTFSTNGAITFVPPSTFGCNP